MSVRSVRVDRRLLRESRAARPHLALAAGLGLVTAVVVVAEAAVLAHVIAAAAFHHATVSSLRGSLIALACVLAARAVLAGGFELSGRLGAARVMAELRDRLARHLLIERPSRRDRDRTGELVAAAVQGVDSLESYFAGYLPSFVLATAVPIAVVIWVVQIDLVSAAILAVTVPILIAFMILVGLGAQSRTRSRWQALALLSSHFLDVVRGLDTLRAHRRERAQAGILQAVGDRYRTETMATLRLAFMSALVLELCAMIGTALVAAMVGVQLTSGHLTLDAGLTVLILCPELYAPLRAVGQQFHAASDGLAAAGGLLEVLDEPAACVEPEHPRPAPNPASVPLRFENVSYAYPGRPGNVLNGLTLELAPQEWVAVVGRSGVGKSTLAALALRLVDPAAGRVRCGATDLRAVLADDWRRRVAWVPQRTRLFSGTIAGNIALADAGAAREQIACAAAQAGLGPLLETLPRGLDTPVGDGGRGLSAGQRQRIAIARALLADASLVVLDEPTANLDRDSAAAVGEAIERLARGRTVLLITHDRGLAARADRTVELRAGTVVHESCRRLAVLEDAA